MALERVELAVSFAVVDDFELALETVAFAAALDLELRALVWRVVRCVSVRCG